MSERKDEKIERLQQKLERYEQRDRVLEAFDRIKRDDLKAFRGKKQAVELAGRNRHVPARLKRCAV